MEALAGKGEGELGGEAFPESMPDEQWSAQSLRMVTTLLGTLRLDES